MRRFRLVLGFVVPMLLIFGFGGAAEAATVGTSSVFSRTNSNVAGDAQDYSFVAAASGQVDGLSVYVDSASTAARITLALYTGTKSSAGPLQRSCMISSPRTGQWNRCTMSPYALTAGTTYWLALLQPMGTAGKLVYREGRASGETYL